MSKKSIGIFLSAFAFLMLIIGNAFFYGSQYIELAVKSNKSASFGIYNDKMYTEYNNNLIYVWGLLMILFSIAVYVFAVILMTQTENKTAAAATSYKVNEESLKALERLNELKKSGILSEEEFNNQKQKLL